MEPEKIELAARELQIEIYRGRDMLWIEADIPPLCKMFSAEVAAKILGVDYELHPQLGRFGDGNHRFEVAGLIDRQGNKIAVARNPDRAIERFTGAHEIGHWQLHKNKMVMHRDRPIAGLGTIRNARSQEEKQADYFAACFLAPRNVVVSEFETRFGQIGAFRFDDTAAFGLRRRNPRSLIVSSEDSYEWELALASAASFHGVFFDSLADAFGVSPSTMAIRLREVGLRRS
jgi:Zn-dependent peptidase ImmA (M78 family)